MATLTFDNLLTLDYLPELKSYGKRYKAVSRAFDCSFSYFLANIAPKIMTKFPEKVIIWKIRPLITSGDLNIGLREKRPK